MPVNPLYGVFERLLPDGEIAMWAVCLETSNRSVKLIGRALIA
jgi:hypothetical protein